MSGTVEMKQTLPSSNVLLQEKRLTSLAYFVRVTAA